MSAPDDPRYREINALGEEIIQALGPMMAGKSPEVAMAALGRSVAHIAAALNECRNDQVATLLVMAELSNEAFVIAQQVMLERMKPEGGSSPN